MNKTASNGGSEIFRRLEIRALTAMTAAAFGVKAPSLSGRTAAECLAVYRRFTVEAAEGRPASELLKRRRDLYRRAFRAGRLLSCLPGLSSDRSRRELIVFLYRNIGIRIEGDIPGHFTVPVCSFSRAYTPRICYVMSGLDAGIICGIFGGGRLVFRQRLTEGCRECQAGYCREEHR